MNGIDSFSLTLWFLLPGTLKTVSGRIMFTLPTQILDQDNQLQQETVSEYLFHTTCQKYFLFTSPRTLGLTSYLFQVRGTTPQKQHQIRGWSLQKPGIRQLLEGIASINYYLCLVFPLTERQSMLLSQNMRSLSYLLPFRATPTKTEKADRLGDALGQTRSQEHTNKQPQICS